MIETKIFIEPRDAFQLVGNEAYGPNWRDDWIDNSDASERKLTLKYLRAALKSGHVAAHWSTMDMKSGGDLTPQEADREFFRIDLENNCAFHHSMNQPVRCRIHADQLRAFMRKQERRTVSATQLDTNKCQEWLVQQFSTPEYLPPKVDDLFRLAKELFPRLSQNGFKEARKNAIQITGRDELAKAGRRKKSNQSAT